MKKWCVFAASLLLGTVLAGCGNGNGSGAANGENKTEAVGAVSGVTEAAEEAAREDVRPARSDNEFIRNVDDILAGIEPLEPYTSIRPEEVPENPESDFIFESAGDHVVITGYQGSSTQVKIPANLGGGTRLTIHKDAFAGNDRITWLYLPETVGSVSKGSFEKCSALQEVYIAGVSGLENRAFKECTALRRVEIMGCREINAETVDPSGAGAFCGCESLEEILFPDDLERMGTGAFEQCIRLQSVDLSKTKLSYLSQNAFLRCYRLERISLPATMQYVNGNACLEAYSLRELQPAEGSPFFVEDNMFYGYQDGNGPNSDNLECIMCLMGARAEEIHIKDGTKSLAFKGIAQNPFVRVITLPDSVGRLENYALSSVDNLEQLVVGSGMTYIGDVAVLSHNKYRVSYQGETYEKGEEFDALCQKLNQ